MVYNVTYLHVKSTVEDYDEWKSDFEGYHTERAEHGGKNYQLFQATDDPNKITVLIEFDNEENARGWIEYLQGEEELTEPEMSSVEISYFDLVEHEQL